MVIEIANIPSTSLQLTLDRTSNSGKTYRLQIAAVNINGQVKSNIINLVTATIPSDPTNPPSSVQSQTNAEQIMVLVSQITDTGSPPITSYELQSDNGKGGSFFTIGGGDSSPTLSTNFLIKSGIQRGVAYRFRYRSRNIVGWSSISSLSASTIPSPPGISYISSNDTQIVLGFTSSTDNGGSIITDYQLDLDGTIVSDYSFAADGYSYTALKSTLSLATGSIYAFRYRAVNSNGESPWSQLLSVGLGSFPSVPAAPTRYSSGNSVNSIGVEWAVLTGQTLPVTAYELYVDDGTSINYKLLYRGGSTQYILANTNPSSTYTFYVDAINFNGVGTLSQGTSLKSCVAPYSILPPTLVSSTSTTVTLSWTSPGNNGGWQVTGFGLLRDNGNGGDINTFVDSGTILWNPNLFEYTVTLAGLTGKLVRFQLQVTNEMGTTTSTGYLAALVAGLPGTPANIVALSDNISGTQIAFMIPEVTDDGGSSIETFQVMIDDEAGGTFNTISGYPINSLKQTLLLIQEYKWEAHTE